MVVSRKMSCGFSQLCACNGDEAYICQHMFFCFSLGFGNMVARLTLTIAVVQRLKCKSKFNKELLTTGHDHGSIRKNTFDRLMGFASVLKVFVCVLSAKLVVDSCLFRICSIFSGVFCRHLSWKQTCGNQTQWKHL